MARLILHIGQAKTGTSSIQHFLTKNAPVLRRSRVIYPKGRNGFRYNHHSLLPLVFTGLHLAVHIRERMGPDTHQAQMLAEKFRCEILHTISTHPGADLVLSGESFLRPFLEDEADRMQRLIQGFGRSVEVYVYLRDPGSHYVSLLQQRLKSASTLPPLRPSSVIRGLRVFRDISDQRLHARVFDRKLLHEGDVVQDFLGWTGLDQIEGLTSVTAVNESMSAEAMDVLYKLGLSERARTRSEKSLQRFLRWKVDHVDRQLSEGTKPRLRPEAEYKLLQQGSELDRLRGDFGVEFPSVNYSELNSASNQQPYVPKSIGDIIAFNKDRRDALLDRVKDKRMNMLYRARQLFQ